ncbi:Excinuclease ABC subunit B [Ruminococcaceae bacterium YRB3002]|nr:Excinuclease ABC subunit B [Ruminococcaceae bacterium YRB3002]
MGFELVSEYKPSGDQPKAIEELVKGIRDGSRGQVLLGVTGSGKTFTMANVIQQIGRPTLVLAHNKTLAGQLYAELKELFPNNAVEYFVSYYDYYQPEAYIAATDTYIEKDSDINDDIDRMRHEATKSLLTRDDVIVVASVSCIYGIGDKEDYEALAVTLSVGQVISPEAVMAHLVNVQYDRNDFEPVRGSFRVRGDVIDIFTPDSENTLTRISFFDDEIDKISFVDKITGRVEYSRNYVEIFPASHYATGRQKLLNALDSIEEELEERLKFLREEGKLIEAYRLEQKTRYDIDLMRETGFCKGIENYSRHISGRKEGEPPCTLMDFFPEDYLLLIDESHQTIPQVGAMYRGDHARKEMLVQYGFRLPSAFDNRPLHFEEFEERMGQTIYVSATPADYEKNHSDRVVEQVIRPTGLLEPEIFIRPVDGQIEDILQELAANKKRGEKSLIMTLTKKMAEDLTEFLSKENIRVEYLHSDIKTVDRMRILNKLRSDEIDVIVGINLLREGIDLPEVSLLMILDADKEGFLRSARSLIQIIGRCARNANGRVILYCDEITDSIMEAVGETNRRRDIQKSYNEEHGIVPKTVIKPVKDIFEALSGAARDARVRKLDVDSLINDGVVQGEIDASEREKMIEKLTKEMKKAAKDLDFEQAAAIRDVIIALKESAK